MRIGSLFSGFGGLDMAVAAHYGATVAWHVEFDKHPSKVLAHHYPDVPNFGDVTTVDWANVEPVDIITGGFPCQDVSHAGLRRGVHQGTRSGLWFEMVRAIDALRPQKVVIENVLGLLSASAAGDVEPCPWCLGDATASPLRALGAVLADLATLGLDAEWTTVRASDAGAPHRRERVFIVATDPGRGQLPRAAIGADRLSEPGERGGDPDGLTLLPTPKASDGPNGGPGMRNGRGVADALPGVVALLPTPMASDYADRSRSANWSGYDLVSTSKDIATDFGPYAAAIARWEAVMGRPAPSPTEPNKDGRPRLSARFVEFMMGLPEGWVTDVDIPRSAQLKALGNGVVPQQALLALSLLDGAR